MKRKILRPIVSLMCLLCLSSAAQAALSIVSTVGGNPPNGANYVTFNDSNIDLPMGGAGGIAYNTTNTDSIAVSFTPASQVVTGSQSGLYAAPVLSGGNGALFDNQADGVDATKYLTTGTSGSTVTLDFSGPQKYLGLLWGSVDDYNTLQFYLGGVLIGNTTTDATLDGLDVDAFADGDQGANGTFYVNINSTLAFDRVVATSTQFAFEFDNVAYSANQIPEPASLIVWSVLGLTFIGAGWWRRRKQTA